MGRRAGTENLIGIAGFGAAAEMRQARITPLGGGSGIELLEIPQKTRSCAILLLGEKVFTSAQHDSWQPAEATPGSRWSLQACEFEPSAALCEASQRLMSAA